MVPWLFSSLKLNGLQVHHTSTLCTSIWIYVFILITWLFFSGGKNPAAMKKLTFQDADLHDLHQAAFFHGNSKGPHLNQEKSEG